MSGCLTVAAEGPNGWGKWKRRGTVRSIALSLAGQLISSWSTWVTLRLRCCFCCFAFTRNRCEQKSITPGQSTDQTPLVRYRSVSMQTVCVASPLLLPRRHPVLELAEEGQACSVVQWAMGEVKLSCKSLPNTLAAKRTNYPLESRTSGVRSKTARAAGPLRVRS